MGDDVRRVLAYSLPPAQAEESKERGEAVVLVWKTSRSSLYASTSHFGAVVAEPRREDRGSADAAVARAFAEETRNAFLTAKQAAARLKAGRGVLRAGQVVALPTRFVATAAMDRTHGQGRWVLAGELVAAVTAGRCEVRAAPGVDGQDRDERVPLSMAFVAVLAPVAPELLRTLESVGGRVGSAAEEEELARAEAEAREREAAAEAEARRAAVPDVSAVYSCARCRRPLFGAAAVEEHEPAGGRPEKCTSHFLRDADAVYAALGGRDAAFAEMQGKIMCPGAKCGAPIGRYNWAGGACACGAWVTPAVQIGKGKVDLRQVRVRKATG